MTTSEETLKEWQTRRRAEEAEWDAANLGHLCVNAQKFNCFHRAHPGGDCSKTYDGGPGRGSSCGCKVSKQIPRQEENVLMIKRHLPRVEHWRVTELVGAG